MNKRKKRGQKKIYNIRKKSLKRASLRRKTMKRRKTR